MPVTMNKSTGSLAKTLPRAKAQVYTPGPVRLSNAKRAQVGLKPNPPSAPKIPQSKMPQVAKTYKGK
jgi:hypothetical protein